MNEHKHRIRKEFDRLSKIVGVDTLANLKKLVYEEWDRQKAAIEVVTNKNSKICPVKDRYIKIATIPEKNAKITFRPDNGEILIKIPANTPEFKVAKLTEVGNFIKENVPISIPNTIRGTAHWSQTLEVFRVSLVSNSKSFRFNVNQ